MAYQVKRTGKIFEELELLDENDNVVHTLKINLDADTMARTLSEKYIELENANQSVKKLSAEMKDKESMDKALERIGHAVYNLYEAVFGEENTKIIIDFYKDRMVEMNLEITPFIRDVIIPRVREIVKDTQRRANYKYNRKEVRKSRAFKKVK